MMKILVILLALAFGVVPELWPKLQEWRLQRLFLSDEITQAARCVVALEHVFPGSGADEGWGQEARLLHRSALDRAFEQYGDELQGASGDLSIARYLRFSSNRIWLYQMLAMNQARQELGLGTGRLNGALAKSWLLSPTCQVARRNALSKGRGPAAGLDVRPESKASAGDGQAVGDVVVPAPQGCDYEYGQKLQAVGLVPRKVSVHGPDDGDFAGWGCAYRIQPAPGTSVEPNSVVTFRSAWEAG
ncbi:hypothetical protein [Variovorax terrae]|uniref:Uncharacterized protein n=1 Tax=Variovorax terrae TaxID=2923278 RepID=A0A9X2AP12_9BURK|nr:hypothetical protein [Variovorax terrae]MCJ0765363.1 hypothetical protein [Variovorax terrae]